MATQRVRCSACGFAALLRRTGESIKLTIDSAKQIQVCDHLSHESQTNSRRLAPLDCRAFRDTVQILANNWKPSTPTLVKDAESKESGSRKLPLKASTRRSGHHGLHGTQKSLRVEVMHLRRGQLVDPRRRVPEGEPPALNRLSLLPERQRSHRPTAKGDGFARMRMAATVSSPSRSTANASVSAR